ncbi:hypothetical protein D3C72_1768930 [compost metagenome]
MILRTLLNYFIAVQQSFIDSNGNSSWSFNESNDNPLQRTIGFQALIKVLIHIFPEGYSNKDLSVDFFKEKLKNASKLQLVDANGNSKYAYSSVGVNKLRDDIINLI